MLLKWQIGVVNPCHCLFIMVIHCMTHLWIQRDRTTFIIKESKVETISWKWFQHSQINESDQNLRG